MPRVRILDDGEIHGHWHGLLVGSEAEIVNPYCLFGTLDCAGQGEFGRFEGMCSQSVPIESMVPIDDEAREILGRAQARIESASSACV